MDYSECVLSVESPYKNYIFYGILIGAGAKILFDIGKPVIKKLAGKAISRAIDIYIDVKWRYRSNPSIEKKVTFSPVWIDKTDSYGVYTVENKKYISFNTEKDLSGIIIDNDTEIDNIKLYNGQTPVSDTLTLSVALDILRACSGPDAMFQCGVPTLNQIKSLDSNNLLGDVTKIIVNLTNYEEFKIEA